MTYTIVQASPESKVGIQLYGGAAEFWKYKGPEVILEGGYEGGKTIACLLKLHILLCKYPNSRALMVRKTYKSLVQSAIVTYENKVLPYPPGHTNCGVSKYGKEKPEFYDYPNGSRLVLGGLDNAGKVLSSEYDFIYVNQAEELFLNDWELLTGRATGRAGHAPYTQVMGDCNPGPPNHWILKRERIQRFRQLHRDNPTLYHQQTGEITAQGKRTIETLSALTGLRRKRGFEGLWVAAEGQVYETYDPALHVINHFPIPYAWRKYRVIDFGYTNPFVCQWWAEDDDGRLYRYREIYHTGRIVQDHAAHILKHSQQERYEYTVADHDAEDRATLERYGITTIAANKAVTSGIQAVQARLRVAGDGKPRLMFLRDSLVELDTDLEAAGKPTCTEDELPAYIWHKTPEGKPDKETPVKLDDHGVDCARYLCAAVDGLSDTTLHYGAAPDALRNWRG